MQCMCEVSGQTEKKKSATHRNMKEDGSVAQLFESGTICSSRNITTNTKDGQKINYTLYQRGDDSALRYTETCFKTSVKDACVIYRINWRASV